MNFAGRIAVARARNIKPAFFDNDDLADNDPLGRLLFIGLWTISDFRGNIEWRSRRIKKQLLAYDDCDITQLAINLDKSGFIRFYSDGDNMYLNINNFNKHQNPHKNERDKGSEIPAFTNEMRQAVDLNTLTINLDKSGLKRNSSTSNPAESLIPYPDSPIPYPDSPILNPESFILPAVVITSNKSDNVIEIFNHWVFVMKKNASAKLTPKRDKNIKARLKDGYTVDQILLAIDGCSTDAFSMGANNNSTPYNDIELICRTGEKLESFIDKTSQTEIFDKVTQSNINNLQGGFLK